ncbi:hypothetical protein PG984_008833 [Apiospora sp. TS-2023a]
MDEDPDCDGFFPKAEYAQSTEFRKLNDRNLADHDKDSRLGAKRRTVLESHGDEIFADAKNSFKKLKAGDAHSANPTIARKGEIVAPYFQERCVKAQDRF